MGHKRGKRKNNVAKRLSNKNNHVFKSTESAAAEVLIPPPASSSSEAASSSDSLQPEVSSLETEEDEVSVPETKCPQDLVCSFEPSEKPQSPVEETADQIADQIDQVCVSSRVFKRNFILSHNSPICDECQTQSA